MDVSTTLRYADDSVLSHLLLAAVIKARFPHDLEEGLDEGVMAQVEYDSYAMKTQASVEMIWCRNGVPGTGWARYLLFTHMKSLEATSGIIPDDYSCDISNYDRSTNLYSGWPDYQPKSGTRQVKGWPRAWTDAGRTRRDRRTGRGGR